MRSKMKDHTAAGSGLYFLLAEEVSCKSPNMPESESDCHTTPLTTLNQTGLSAGSVARY